MKMKKTLEAKESRERKPLGSSLEQPMQKARPGRGVAGFGAGVIAAFFFLMTGDTFKWWEIAPPLRYAVMGGLDVGVCLVAIGYLWSRFSGERETPSRPDGERE